MRNLLYTAFLFGATVACAPSDAPPTAPEVEPYTETGEASFYANSLAGNQTYDGSTYRPDSMTAAHNDLPMGTVVEVTNLENDRSVVVTINDRGPHAADRIIDLSRAAADSLDFIDSGHVDVRLTVIEAAEGYTVADSVAQP